MARDLRVSFGLLTVAMKSDKATITRPEMKNLCTGQPGKDEHPHTPLTAPKVCAHCGPITDYDALSKGVKMGDAYVAIDKSDIDEARETFTKEFKGTLNLIPHPSEQFLAQTSPGGSINYLVPADAASADHYALLVKLVQSHPELSFASLHTPVSATALYHLTVREGVLVMESRVREEAMKPVPSVGGVVNDQLYTMLEAVLPTFSTPYVAGEYEDKYLTALEGLVATGIAYDTGSKDAVAPTITSDTDLIEKLRALQGCVMRRLIEVGKEIMCPICLDDDELMIDLDVRAEYIIHIANGVPLFILNKPQDVTLFDLEEAKPYVRCCKCDNEYQLPANLEVRER